MRNEVKSRCNVLLQMAQHCGDGRVCWGHLRLEVRRDLFPFQKWMSISVPELVAMSERVMTCKYSLLRLNFWSLEKVKQGGVYESSILVYSCTGSMAYACRNSGTPSVHHGRQPLFHPPSSLSAYCSLSQHQPLQQSLYP